ncbi:hypothetical protein LTR94_024971 [Friedmanniomyces endolithicus]|nr:hypothetical protein LTR94_024971 [Friedmanniomyces endolithicus]
MVVPPAENVATFGAPCRRYPVDQRQVNAVSIRFQQPGYDRGWITPEGVFEAGVGFDPKDGVGLQPSFWDVWPEVVVRLAKDASSRLVPVRERPQRASTAILQASLGRPRPVLERAAIDARNGAPSHLRFGWASRASSPLAQKRR